MAGSNSEKQAAQRSLSRLDAPPAATKSVSGTGIAIDPLISFDRPSLRVRTRCKVEELEHAIADAGDNCAMHPIDIDESRVLAVWTAIKNVPAVPCFGE